MAVSSTIRGSHSEHNFVHWAFVPVIRISVNFWYIVYGISCPLYISAIPVCAWCISFLILINLEGFSRFSGVAFQSYSCWHVSRIMYKCVQYVYEMTLIGFHRRWRFRKFFFVKNCCKWSAFAITCLECVLLIKLLLKSLILRVLYCMVKSDYFCIHFIRRSNFCTYSQHLVMKFWTYIS